VNLTTINKFAAKIRELPIPIAIYVKNIPVLATRISFRTLLQRKQHSLRDCNEHTVYSYGNTFNQDKTGRAKKLCDDERFPAQELYKVAQQVQ
jgi:hypothetical protein